MAKRPNRTTGSREWATGRDALLLVKQRSPKLLKMLDRNWLGGFAAHHAEGTLRVALFATGRRLELVTTGPEYLAGYSSRRWPRKGETWLRGSDLPMEGRLTEENLKTLLLQFFADTLDSPSERDLRWLRRETR